MDRTEIRESSRGSEQAPRAQVVVSPGTFNLLMLRDNVAIYKVLA